MLSRMLLEKVVVPFIIRAICIRTKHSQLGNSGLDLAKDSAVYSSRRCSKFLNSYRCSYDSIHSECGRNPAHWIAVLSSRCHQSLAHLFFDSRSCQLPELCQYQPGVQMCDVMAHVVCQVDMTSCQPSHASE